MSIDSINLVVWVAIGAVTVGLIWFDSKTGELSVARILKSPPYWGVATVIALEAADPSLVPALIIAPATMAGIAFYLLLKPSNFPAAFIILSLIYFFNRKKEGILRRAFLDWLEPILLGMLLITTLLATAMWFIPRSNWRWLLWLDDGALQVHSFLEAVLPKSLWAKSILLFGIALVNASLPRLRKWTDKFNRVLKGLKRGAGTVAIFVSMTIFAHGQSGEIGEKVADEKFERLKPSAEAMAQLAISTRVASNPGAETNDAQEWLNSIAYGVKAELDAPKLAREDILASRKELIERYLLRRVEALKEAVASHRAVGSAGTVINEQIVRLLGRELNEHERAEARRTFEKAVDTVIGEAAKSTTPLLVELLGQDQAPQAARELIKELYKAEASEVAKAISGPMADIAFRPRTTSTVEASERFARIVNSRTFNPDSLPREIARPTAAEVWRRRSAVSEVERATRAAKR